MDEKLSLKHDNYNLVYNKNQLTSFLKIVRVVLRIKPIRKEEFGMDFYNLISKLTFDLLLYLFVTREEIIIYFTKLNKKLF